MDERAALDLFLFLYNPLVGQRCNESQVDLRSQLIPGGFDSHSQFHFITNVLEGSWWVDCGVE